MITKTNKVFKVFMTLALVLALLGGTTKVNAASSDKLFINDKYGKLKGRVFGTKDPLGKYFESQAETKGKVPRIYSDIEVQYHKTGKTIAKDTSNWKYDNNLAHAYVEMDKIPNELNKNKKDGFIGTKCTAYGCAEAIVKKAYTIFTSCIY